MKIIERTQKITSAIENPDIPFFYYILTFIACITLRNFLEIFSDQAKIYFKLLPAQDRLYVPVWQGLTVSFLHYYVFWITLFLAISILLRFITKENISKIIRALFALSFIINITPLFDLIASGGQGFNITYAHPKGISTFIWLPATITPGMTFTGTTAIIIAFAYVWTKTNSIRKGLAGGLSLYALLLIAGLLPFLLQISHPLPLIRFLLISVFFEVLVIFYLLKKEKFLTLIKDFRILKALHFAFMFFLGIFLAKEPISRVISANIDTFLLTQISALFAWISIVIFNNLGGLNINKSDKPAQASTMPAISENYKKFALITVSLSAIFALGVNFQTLIFMLLLMGNSFLYYLPPLQCKRIPLFSKLFISFNSLIAVMLGYLFAGKELLEFPTMITWYFLIFVTLCLNFMDLKGYEEDKISGALTIPAVVGIKKAKFFIGGLFLITYSALSLVLLDLRLLLPGLFLGGIQFFLLTKKSYQEKWVLITHLAGLILLFLYLGKYA